MTPGSDAESVVRTPARLLLFGFGPTEATVTLERRTRAWRITRTLRVLAATALAAPLLGLVPPHAPWVLGALGGGLLLARRRWNHRFSVRELSARCPRCDAEVTVPSGTRLRAPHPVPCESCHHESTLEIPREGLPHG